MPYLYKKFAKLQLNKSLFQHRSRSYVIGFFFFVVVFLFFKRGTIRLINEPTLLLCYHALIFVVMAIKKISSGVRPFQDKTSSIMQSVVERELDDTFVNADKQGQIGLIRKKSG
jgi:hypothetical protein